MAEHPSGNAIRGDDRHGHSGPHTYSQAELLQCSDLVDNLTAFYARTAVAKSVTQVRHNARVPGLPWAVGRTPELREPADEAAFFGE